MRSPQGVYLKTQCIFNIEEIGGAKAPRLYRNLFGIEDPA